MKQTRESARRRKQAAYYCAWDGEQKQRIHQAEFLHSSLTSSSSSCFAACALKKDPTSAPLRGDRVIGWWRDNAFLYPFPIYLYRQPEKKKSLFCLFPLLRGGNFAAHILLFAIIVIFRALGFAYLFFFLHSASLERWSICKAEPYVCRWFAFDGSCIAYCCLQINNWLRLVARTRGRGRNMIFFMGFLFLKAIQVIKISYIKYSHTNYSLLPLYFYFILEIYDIVFYFIIWFQAIVKFNSPFSINY